jgi:parallel beta-helix repeat protein
MKNPVIGPILLAILVSTLAFVSNIPSIKGAGNIYILPDGSISPSTAPITTSDKINYFFTGSINDPIVIQRSSITVDGKGFTLQGTGTGWGFYLTGITGVRIKDTNIKSFQRGIYVLSSSRDNFSGNNITGNTAAGMYLYSSSNNNITGNNIKGNSGYGICLSSSSNNAITGNNVENNSPAIYLTQSSSNNNVIQNSIKGNNGYGIYLSSSSISNKVIGNKITGNFGGSSIMLDGSSNNVLNGNDIESSYDGIYMLTSSRNNVTGNKIEGSNVYGISLYTSSRNRLTGNNITGNNSNGIEAYNCLNNSITGNNIKNNANGLYLYSSSSNNNVTENNIASNGCGIILFSASNNRFYHNNFTSNTNQIKISPLGLVNVWNDSYPSGGNYWSDYTGIDLKKGSKQDQPGSDGIGDTPYIIDVNNLDKYPLTVPYGTPSIPTYALTIEAELGGTTNPSTGTYLYSRGQSVPVQAIPSPSYFFSHWEKDGTDVGSANPYRVVIDNNHTLQSIFACTLKINTTAGGTTYPPPGSEIYDVGTNASVDAIPQMYYYFDHWVLDDMPAGQTNPIIIEMNSNHTIHPVFANYLFDLTILSSSHGTTDPIAGSTIYIAGTNVSVTAISENWYILDHWELDGTNLGDANPLTLIIDANHELRAIFKIHDIAVTNLTSSPRLLTEGSSINVIVTVANHGNYSETFNVTITLLETRFIILYTVTNLTLENDSSTTLTIELGLSRGLYDLSASVMPVPYETNLSDNFIANGVVRVAPMGHFRNSDARIIII